jgi:two-component system chemotaxis sensor kinase CheA
MQHQDPTAELPAEIVARFRAKALERIEKLEAGWTTLTSSSTPDPAVIDDVQRELHTLKGDSRVVGFTDVNLLCHKLEDLLAAAHRLDYRVAEDFDLVLTMALRFLAMLVTKKAGVALGGIDLPGFVTEVDAALREARLVQLPDPGKRVSGTQKIVRLQRSQDRLSHETRTQFAVAATTVFLEHLMAEGGARRRLYHAWCALRTQLAATGAVQLKPLLARHAQTVTELARDLGKEIDIRFEVSDVRLKTEAADAIDTALLHILRNAVDHGIETPAVRRAAGKRSAGRIAVHVRQRLDAIELEVEDDGAGIDFAAVRQRGVDRGLLRERRAQTATDDELVELLFQSGFSTSPEVSDVSGRGVGLDAVRSSLSREGGSIALSTQPGGGTTFVVMVPSAGLVVPVHCFPALSAEIQIAIPAGRGWSLRPATTGASLQAVDPLAILLDGSGPPATSFEGCVLRLEDATARFRSLVWSSGTPKQCSAERICPTTDDHPAEIILIEGREAVLFRPQLVVPNFARLPSDEAHPR